MSQRALLDSSNQRGTDAVFNIAELIERIANDLGRLTSAAPFVVLTWPLPRLPSERLLAADSEGSAVLWAPPGEEEICGLGAAFTLAAQGPDRFSVLRAQAVSAWSQLDSSQKDALAPMPRFFGGFAFQAGQADRGLWQGFGDARFVLPQLCYVKSPSGAWLQLVVRSTGWDRAAFQSELQAKLTRALRALFTVPARERRREVAREEDPEGAWTTLVAAIKAEIEQGRAQKIVVARRVSLSLDRELLPEVVLSRLREDAPESTRFAFRVGDVTFLGATPEQLVEKRGLELRTEAVAGSMSVDDAGSAARLLESDKDIREHEFVVREILRVLEPLTSDLSPAAKREVHRLRTVLHLRTTIRGTLREASHVLELVARLHPTPAVGGVPTEAAIAFITAHERHQRGWYTGPLGWFDAAGDGRFVVALRSGVVRGKLAELYAGAGIVQASNAPSELAETRWKLAALLGALGVS